MAKKKQNGSEKLDHLIERVDTIYDILAGDLEQDKPGLMERVRRMEIFQRGQQKIAWGLFGVVGADAVLRLWVLVFPK